MNTVIDDQCVAALILAAGDSVRLGTPKQLLRFHGETLVRRTVRISIEAGFSPIIVIAPAALRLSSELDGLSAGIVEIQSSQEGVAGSLKAGIRCLKDRQSSAAAVLLCDQPLITADDLRKLKIEFESSGKPIAAAAYEQELGVPAIFSSSLFTRLLELTGDVGARSVIRGMRENCSAVAMPSAAFDVDTPDDAARLRSFESSSGSDI